MTQNTELWDVIVVGGGAAGMMTAGVAAKNGAKVLLLEKNDTLGKKLLISGGGRCNVTNAEFDTRTLLAKYKSSDKFLASSFAQFNATQSIEFFNSRGMPTVVEDLKRAFPASHKSQSVWDVLFKEMNTYGVEVRSQSPALFLERSDGAISGIKLADGTILRARSYILATGGLSHPETGSTGDGFKMLGTIGHTINPANAALVPVAVREPWIQELAGISLQDCKISLFQFEQKVHTSRGKVLFTHVGLSGPGILNSSSTIGSLIPNGDVRIELDLLPQFDYGTLNTHLQEIFKINHVKKIQNSLSDLIPRGLVSIILTLSKIDPDTACNSITRDQRITLGKSLKHFSFQVLHLLGTDKAVITSGGVPLTEVDTKNMRSKLFSNIYIIGDLLDIDRPSGGYSLQLCWTTGYVAGLAAANNKSD
ncbi:MAG: flavoprotein [Candidatus Kaiserbacteria bacterium]|nr:flavoprotein [Candidatus Kaiserbacteria bacterium]